MRIIKQGYEIIDELVGEKILKKLERCARVCYKSEDKICDGSAEKLLTTIIKLGHESVLEHFSFTVVFVTDRSTTHELVRHRIASFSQESQRYIDYGGKDICFIIPEGVEENSNARNAYELSYMIEEENYKMLRQEYNQQPQLARAVLGNGCATQIVITANIREWRHIFKLRTSKAAHPTVRALLIPLLKELQNKIPVLFDDIKIDN